MRKFVVAALAISLTPLGVTPSHAADRGSGKVMIPCAEARTVEQVQACDTIRAIAESHGLTGSDEAASEPARCSGNSRAYRKSFAFVAKEYWADMAVTCNYHVSLCAVSMFAAASAPHYTYGIGLLDTSTYCSAETINHSYGWSLNVTTTIGSCLSNNTFWVESEPETRVWT